MPFTKDLANTVHRSLLANGLDDFTLAKPDGAEFCSFVSARSDCKREVSVYPSKHFKKGGGRIYVELFCIHTAYNRAWGFEDIYALGENDSWQLKRFQYRLSQDSIDTEYAFRSDALNDFEQWLTEFLADHGKPWFKQFESTRAYLSIFGEMGSCTTSLCGYGT